LAVLSATALNPRAVEARRHFWRWLRLCWLRSLDAMGALERNEFSGARCRTAGYDYCSSSASGSDHCDFCRFTTTRFGDNFFRYANKRKCEECAKSPEQGQCWSGLVGISSFGGKPSSSSEIGRTADCDQESSSAI